MPNKSPKTIGEISEAQVIARLLLAGEVVLQPFGDNQRYDLVVDRTGLFLRVQVKTGRLRDGAVRFKTCSWGSTTDHKTSVSYVGHADLFAVYCPENDKVYLVPVEECGKAEHSLRVQIGCQQKGVHLAADYEYPHGRVAQQVGAVL